AVSLDQSGAFRNFNGQLTRMFRRIENEAEPALDLTLLLLETVTEWAQRPQLGEQPEAQITADGSGVDFHGEIDPAEPAPLFGHAKKRTRQERRQQLAQLLDARLEKIVHRERLAAGVQFLARDAAHARRLDLGLRDAHDIFK